MHQLSCADCDHYDGAATLLFSQVFDSRSVLSCKSYYILMKNITHVVIEMARNKLR